MPEAVCRRCRGSGLTKTKQDIGVLIPAGAPDGLQLSLPGQGTPSPNGGSRGKLILFVYTADHPRFTRDGADLHCDISIDFTQAILGETVSIETIEGKQIDLKIPPGTGNRTTLRVPRHGLKRFHAGGRGSLLVNVTIKMPEEISKKEQRLLEELREIRRNLGVETKHD